MSKGFVEEDYGDFLQSDSNHNLDELGGRNDSGHDIASRNLAKYLADGLPSFALHDSSHHEVGPLNRLLDDQSFGESSVMDIGTGRGAIRFLEESQNLSSVDDLLHQTNLGKFLDSSISDPSDGELRSPGTATTSHPHSRLLDGRFEIPRDESPSAHVKVMLRPGSAPVRKTSLTSAIHKRTSSSARAHRDGSSSLTLGESNGPTTRASQRRTNSESDRKTLSGEVGAFTPARSLRKLTSHCDDDDEDDDDDDGSSVAEHAGPTKERQCNEEKRRRRAESNRLSAERSRERKKKYMKELESGMRLMQTHNQDLKKALGFYRQQISVLQEVIRLNGDSDQKLAANAVENALRQYQSQIPTQAPSVSVGANAWKGVRSV